jgi:hypothetical protein
MDKIALSNKFKKLQSRLLNVGYNTIIIWIMIHFCGHQGPACP